MFLMGPPKDKFALSSFSPYFLLFGCASIQWDAMAIIKMDDPNVWI
jgi:hypothetical protein